MGTISGRPGFGKENRISCWTILYNFRVHAANCCQQQGYLFGDFKAYWIADRQGRSFHA
jgi:hypothetical protein